MKFSRDQLANDLKVVLAKYDMRILRDDGLPMTAVADRDVFRILIEPIPTREAA